GNNGQPAKEATVLYFLQVAFLFFVGVKVGKVSIESVIKQLLYYFGAIFVVLMLVTYIPQLSLWLPTVLGVM
ncbi:hypothetical protein, partial [Dubosiella newyorkensis]|uniref:hypothetical protein n=1 Tax=Dubosiella newyorkensis TaxID=1862672 RepID=UPI00272B9B12